MANMPYCRFQNTLNDLDECLEVMLEIVCSPRTADPLSQAEHEAMLDMFNLLTNFMYGLGIDLPHDQLEDAGRLLEKARVE